MDTKQRSALVLAALACCAASTERRAYPVHGGMTLPQCLGSLHGLIASPLLAPFRTARIVGKPKCIVIGRRGLSYAATTITYDFSTVNPLYLKALRVNAAAPAVIFFVIQKAPQPPEYQVLLTSSRASVAASGPNGGDITVSPAKGMTMNVEARLAIVDGPYAPADSKVYWWNSADPTQSIGAALLGSANCPGAGSSSVSTCPGAQPPAWPFTGYPRRILQGGGHNWLALTFPTVRTNIYEYWLRAFGHGTMYDIDPKIINQPV